MNRKIINVLVIIVMCVCINLFDNETYAAEGRPIQVQNGTTGTTGVGGIVGDIVDEAESSLKSPITNPDYYAPKSKDTVSGADKLKNIGNTIIGTLQVIGTIISVVVLVVLGIKYMIGSAEERAEYKKSMMPYVIGAVMVFAITNLLGIVAEIAKGLL
jgi:type IV secretory pathway VirB2 component (pilin)